MILSDNETKFDLINNEAIAKTIVSIIKENDQQPISIGIHGDWGSGKSSILEMIEENFKTGNTNSKEEYLCIRFNGWKYQGFEDSKIALMSTIVSELSKNEKVSQKGKDIVKRLWGNINWMSIAKSIGKSAIGMLTGTGPISVLASTLDTLKAPDISEDDINNVIDTLESFMNGTNVSGDTSSNTDFDEFQKNFQELLSKARIKKLVILIDDLDRCLPDVAIDIMEAARLFMFTEKTAVVIAADESMISYAVKKHFPDISTDNNISQNKDFSKNYLEKLIQVPFRIPALGQVESRIYIMELLVGSDLSEENDNFKRLRNEGLNRIKKPWEVKAFSIEDVKDLLGEDYEKVEDKVIIALQISRLLADNTDGNPRKIKRFINMLLLREQVAEYRGYSEYINLSILAKMMLAEYYFPEFYKELPSHLNYKGEWDIESEDGYDEKQTDTNDMEENDVEEKNTKGNWYVKYNIDEWLDMEPSIEKIDLRPYYYACKEKIDYFAKDSINNDLNEYVDLLFRDEMLIAGHKSDIEKLSNQEADRIFEIVSSKITENGEYLTKPKGIDGLFAFTRYRKELRSKLIQFVSSLPIEKLGIWVSTGWDDVIPKDCKERGLLDDFFKSLKTNGSEAVKKTLISKKR